jgi:hypothetical protein
VKAQIVLCRHKGFFARLIRLVTRSKWDHISIRDECTGEVIYLDFNYPHGARHLKESERPWVAEMATTKVDIKDIIHNVPLKYTPLFNLNYFTYRWFKWAPFRGMNCVAFVAEYTGMGKKYWYLSPEELALHIAAREFDAGDSGRKS